MYCSDCLTACILDQGQEIKYFCRISLVMYLVYYNYSNAGPECQDRGFNQIVLCTHRIC